MSATLAQITRAAADGARLTIDLPDAAGTLEWHGVTKIAGPGFARSFSLAQRGGNSAIPTHIFPGGRVESFQRRGYDLTLYEAADRSDSCLIWVGPHNEATTWFNGPAPRRSVLNALVAAVDFADTPEGATVKARVPAVLQQFGTTVIGANDRLTIMATDARTSRESLPDWQGANRGSEEVWKVALDVDPDQKPRLAGTPYEWKYTFANAGAVFTVQFTYDLDNASMRAADTGLADAVLAGLKVQWS